MNSESLVKGIYKWKPLGARTAGRRKNRWEDVMKDMKKKKKIRGLSPQATRIVSEVNANFFCG
jgi:hypothetical protein